MFCCSFSTKTYFLFKKGFYCQAQDPTLGQGQGQGQGQIPTLNLGLQPGLDWIGDLGIGLGLDNFL